MDESITSLPADFIRQFRNDPEILVPAKLKGKDKIPNTFSCNETCYVSVRDCPNAEKVLGRPVLVLPKWSAPKRKCSQKLQERIRRALSDSLPPLQLLVGIKAVAKNEEGNSLYAEHNETSCLQVVTADEIKWEAENWGVFLLEPGTELKAKGIPFRFQNPKGLTITLGSMILS